MLLALFANSLSAQLRIGGDAGARMIHDGAISQPLPLWDAEPVFLAVLLREKPGTRPRARFDNVSTQVVPEPFDFAAAKPYLAFFCRLELNIEEATRFPVRFRLGEVRGWQQELSKRE